MKKTSNLALVMALSMTVSACSMQPKILQTSDHVNRAELDLQSLYKSSVAIDKPLTLSESISRGLMYNLDFRITMMEEVLQNNQLTLANFNMLPRLTANAGYGWRDTERATSSISLRTRNESLEPSFSEERVVRNADLSLSWNLLDFGLSYYQAKQQSDRVLIAVERRRRVMNNMVKEIQASYWKALSAQQLLPQVHELINQTDQALIDSKRIEEEELQSPLKTLEYRRTLLQVMTQLRQLDADLSIAKAQLSSLIAVPPGESFELAGLDNGLRRLPMAPRSLDSLHNYSLVYRPELREESYQYRIDEQNVKKEVLRMFPGLSLLASTNYDSNRLLAFQNWDELGLRATWNLINVLQGPKAIEAAKSQVEIAELRRLALSGAILSQVSVSYNQYLQALEGYSTANALSDIERDVLKIRNDLDTANSGTRLSKIQSSAQSLAAQLERDNAFATAQTAYSTLLVSVGVDLLPAGEGPDNLGEMDTLVNQKLNEMMNADLQNYIENKLEYELTIEEEYEAPLPTKKPIRDEDLAEVVEATAVVEKAEAKNRKGFWSSVKALFSKS